MACETSGIKLQGPSLCIRTHGWKFLSKKVDRLLTKNPLSETNVEFGFFVSSFLGQLFCFRISPCWSQHRIGPCKFIPIGDSRHNALNRKLREVLAIYREAEDLVNIGAYKHGSNPKIDYSLEKINEVNDLLCQGIYEPSEFFETVEKLKKIFE